MVHRPLRAVLTLVVLALAWPTRAQQPRSLGVAFELDSKVNVYDSLGEGLETAGGFEEALAQYEEAVKRGEAGDPLLDAFRVHRDAARKKVSGH